MAEMRLGPNLSAVAPEPPPLPLPLPTPRSSSSFFLPLDSRPLRLIPKARITFAGQRHALLLVITTFHSRDQGSRIQSIHQSITAGPSSPASDPHAASQLDPRPVQKQTQTQTQQTQQTLPPTPHPPPSTIHPTRLGTSSSDLLLLLPSSSAPPSAPHDRKELGLLAAVSPTDRSRGPRHHGAGFQYVLPLPSAQCRAACGYLETQHG